MLSTKTRRVRTQLLAGGVGSSAPPSFETLFGEAPYVDVPEESSIFGPGAYFMDLMAVVETRITARYPELGPLSLQSRRPDLWNLLLTPENATEMVSNADLVAEALESVVAFLPLEKSSFPTVGLPSSPQPPGEVEVITQWEQFAAGTTYVLSALASQPFLVGSTPITASVTLRGAPWMVEVSVGSTPLTVGGATSGSAAPEITIENCYFSFASGATATSLLEYTGGALTLRNCVFSAGSGSSGWGISCPSTGAPSGILIVENCTFVDTSLQPKAPAVDVYAAGDLRLEVRDTILWPTNSPSSGYAAVSAGDTTVVSLDFCDVRGGGSSVNGSRVEFGSANFDTDPQFAASEPAYAKVTSASPTIGRGSTGNDVGPTTDVYSLAAWAVYPFELPFDMEAQTAALALDALDTDLDAIAEAVSAVPQGGAQTSYYAVSQLGLSLGDYLLLTQPLSTGLEPYFGLTSFADEAVTVSPQPPPDRWIFPAVPFAKRIGLSSDLLRDLVYEDLSPAEIAGGVQGGGELAGVDGWAGFYVNGYGASACGTLELLTQYVPAGRNVPDFTNPSCSPITWTALTSPPTGSFTVSFWMLSGGREAGTVLSIGGTAASWQIGEALQLEVTLANSAGLNVDISAFFGSKQWLEVTTVYDASAAHLTVYINGEKAADTAVSSFALPANPAMTLGTIAADTAAASVCDLAIWSRPLGADEIAVGFQQPAMTSPSSATVAPDDLVAFWPIAEGSSTILDWAANYPKSPNNGKAATFASGLVGLPHRSHAADGFATLDGVDFVEIEMLTTSGGGLTTANLDRVSRFVRLAARLGWSFLDLDWTLFTLFHLDGTLTDFTDIGVFENLAALSAAQQRLDLPLQQVCALFGPIKPFGHGRLGDAAPPFDQIFNAPPLEAPPFSPDMSLTLSITSDFAPASMVVRRLASTLDVSIDEITALAQNVAGAAGSITLDASTLSALYSLRLLASVLDVGVRSLFHLLEFTKLSPLGPRTPLDLQDFLREMERTSAAGLDPADLRVLVPPAPGPVPDPDDQRLLLELQDALPKLRTNLGRDLSVARVLPTSFVSADVDEKQSAVLYQEQIENGWIDSSGVITSEFWARLPVAPYAVPSVEYPTIGDAVQAAIASLKGGAVDATVLIRPGTYQGAGNAGLSLTVPSGRLILQSEAGAQSTVIDCGGKTPFLTVAQGGTGSVAINGLTVQNGSSSDNGGAISSQCSLALDGCIFSGNTAQNGGAVAMLSTALTLQNCLLHGNTAAVSGGALYLVAASADATFCTFFANSSASNASNGFFLDPTSTLTLNGSIAWDHPDNTHPDWNVGPTVFCSYSDVNSPTEKPSGAGCIYVDPQLLAPEGGLFQPGPKSPCIGKGPDDQSMGYRGGPGAAMGEFALYPFAYAQIEALRRAVAGVFPAESLPIATVLDALGPTQNGLDILGAGVDAGPAIAYLQQVYRYLLMAYLFRLDGKLLGLVLAHPDMFSLQPPANGPYEPDAEDVRTLATFAALRAKYPEAEFHLLAYLQASRAGTTSQSPAAALAAIFGWDATDVSTFLGTVSSPLTLGPVLAIARAIELSEQTGLDSALLLSLYHNGLIFGVGGARPLLEAVTAMDEDVASSLAATVTDLKREVLKRFAIPQIDAAIPGSFPVVEDNDLSDYLLMDVDMGVQTTTSRLVQATLSVQQYIQRCRLGLEPGVGAIGVSDVEWDWISGFRTWQANRKVFVHPEDYVRPELRKDKTPAFIELEHALTNTLMTKDGLEGLFRRYLDQFLAVATLQTVGSWYQPSDRIATSLLLHPPSSGAGVYGLPVPLDPYAELTAEGWFHPSGAIDSSYPANLFGIHPNTADGSMGCLYFTLATDTAQPAANCVDKHGGTITVQAPMALDAGTWTHLCCVVAPSASSGMSTLTLYVNGVPVVTSLPFAAYSGGLGDPVMSIGASDLGPNPIGLAELRLWSVARSPAQILAGMHRRVLPGEPDYVNLLGYWDFQNDDFGSRAGNWSMSQGTGSTFSFNALDLDAAAGGTCVDDTWHFVGRTPTAPYSYYLRTKRNCSDAGGTSPTGSASVWGPWEPIGVTIAQEFASPVVADGQLYVFWVEGEESAEPSMADSTSSTTKTYQATLKYTRRTASGTWTAAQTLVAGLSLSDDLANLPPKWRKPLVVPIAYEGQTAILAMYYSSTSNPQDMPCFILRPDGTVVTTLALDPAVFSNTLHTAFIAETTPGPVFGAWSGFTVPDAMSPLDGTDNTLEAIILDNVGLPTQAIPVTNQVGACTLISAGNDFLVRAYTTPATPAPPAPPAPPATPATPIDAQLRASVQGTAIGLTTTDSLSLVTAQFSFERLTTSTGPALAAALAVSGIDGLMSAASQHAPEFDLAALGPDNNVVPPSNAQISFSLTDAFGIYFRELFFFVPWLIAERLSANRKFKDARTFYEYIFKPSDAASGGDYWRSAWLAATTSETAIDALEELDPAALAMYRDDPFDAGAIADLRPVAYQRAIVTAYIRNLIAWGDDEFATNTRESINQAAALYRFASDLLGPRPRHVDYTPPPPETYGELALQAYNEFLTTLDDIGSGVSTPPPPGEEPNGSVAGLGLYFGLPDSPDFLSNWDLVEDRLEKIRSGLSLTGDVNDLPLFQAAFSTADIQRLGGRTATRGPGTSSAAADAASETQARFFSLLYAARGLAQSVAEFGSSLLRALEMHDAEALAELQVGQQSVIADRIRQIRTDEVNNALSNAAMAQAALAAASFRRDFYARMQREGWSITETTGVGLAANAPVTRGMSAILNGVAAPLYLIPSIWGTSIGGSSPGAAAQAAAAAAGDLATNLSEASSLANTVGSYERRAQEWAFQERLAEFDVRQLTQQLSIAHRQLDSAQLQFALDTTSFEQTERVKDYYSTKFANAELYMWLSARLGQLHEQLYRIAINVAQMAQATLTAITDNDQEMLSAGTWDAHRGGLLAGESLIVDLARMEQAYLQWESTAEWQSTTKTISLRALDPTAYLNLVNTGSCHFRLPESLFDRDLPGHYLRTIARLSVAVPGIEEDRSALVGTLTCLAHDTVRHADASAVRFLLGASEPLPGTALRRSLRPRRAVLSHAPDASGHSHEEFFSGNLDAFSGAGAVSTWRLEIPKHRSRVPLDNIDDVVLSLTYNSRHGGERFQAEIEPNVPPYQGTLLLDLARDFPSEWEELKRRWTTGLPAEITLTLRPEMLPRPHPGKTFNLVSLHISGGARVTQESGKGLVVETPLAAPRPVALQPVPSLGDNGEAAVLAEPLPDLPTQSWTVELAPIDRPGSARTVWILADYEEADITSGDGGA